MEKKDQVVRMRPHHGHSAFRNEVLTTFTGLRCTSTGRKCDGYEFAKDQDITKLSSSTSTAPPTSLPPTASSQITRKTSRLPPEVFIRSSTPTTSYLTQVFNGTVQERRAFHRFKYRTVPAFAGGSETEFWTSLVLRAATAEPVIREAVIALGTLHEDYETNQGQYRQAVTALAPNSSDSSLAATLYGKAIRGLYTRIDTVQGSGDTAHLAVIASIIFACFEVLRRNDMAAVMHYQNGMRELMRQMNARDQARIEDKDVVVGTTEIVDENCPLMKAAPQDDLDRMLRVFARYDVQACTFSKPKTEPLGVKLPAVPNLVRDVGLTEVRRYLDNLLIAVYQLVKSDLSMFRYWKDSEVSPAWLEKRDEAVKTFQGWLDVLEDAIPGDALTLRCHGITASKSILGLILQVKIAMIMLRTCINCGEETTYDKFDADFEEMVSRVENLTKILGLRDGKPLDRETIPFSMELGVVHPLFFIAWKCRDYRIRRRAIAELKKCGKEGVWEGPIMAVLADRIAQVEEKDIQPGEAVPEQCRIHDMRKSVEYDERLIRVEMRIAEDSTWKNWTTLREAIPF